MKNWMTILRDAAGEGGSGGGADSADDTKDVLGAAADDSGADAKNDTVEGGGDDVLGGDAKGEDGKGGQEAKGEDGKGEDDDPANAVPGEGETYEFTLPEGMEVDAALAEAAQPVLRELGLTRGQADKLAELMATVRQNEATAIADEFVKRQKDYVSTARADEEVGGTKWDDNVKVANAALQKFGTPELTAALREHGLSNHPEMIRFMLRVGLHTADDVADNGKHVDTTEVSPEERWYGKTTPMTKRQ